MKNRSLMTILTGLIFCAACDAPNSTSLEKDTVFQDGTTTTMSLLLTGEKKTDDTGNSWFCTFLNDGQYLKRVPMQLWRDGTGTLDNEDIIWQKLGNLYTISNSNVYYEMTAPAYTERLSFADKFEANLNSQESIKCDWVGPPRVGFFQDEKSATTSTEFDSGDSESIDTMLITGLNIQEQANYWNCADYTENYIGSYYELRFFDTGMILNGETGTWRADRTDGFSYKTPSTETRLFTNVQFSNLMSTTEKFTFTANSTQEILTRCELEGPPRTASLQ